ncbi:MAG: hypothetical protein AAFX99_28415, partial [Myxococcota bacterium]
MGRGPFLNTCELAWRMGFGTHMIKQGYITPHQLLEALTIQLRQSPMLGEIAEHEGLMTLEQVLDVLNYQAKFPE